MELAISPTIAGNSFVATSQFMTIQTAETYALLVDNLSGSTKRVLITHLDVGSNLTTLSEGKVFLKVYQGPTVSANGTEIVPTNMKPGSSTTPQMKIYRSPTISNKGTLKLLRVSMMRAASDGENQVMFLEPGQKLLISAEGSMTADCHFDLNWLEMD